MNKNGLLSDVLIEDHYYNDARTGMRIFSGFDVWAHKDARPIIEAIPGVHLVIPFDTNFSVYLDPRYDREYLRAEIEAQVKIYFSEARE